MKLKLYLDFDGVILDTVSVTDKQIEELNIIDEETKQQFYKDIDWTILLKETCQINNSISNIQKIMDSNLYDVGILTHVNSELEGILKTEYLQSHIPNLNVIPVFKTTDKCDAVDPINSILVDDLIDNLTKWNDKGGISIKFADRNINYNFPEIDDLSKVIDMYDSFINIVQEKQVVTSE